MDLPGLWVYSVPIYEDGPGWGRLGLSYRLVWAPVMVDVTGEPSGSVFVIFQIAVVGGSGWPVVVAAVARGA